MFGRDSNEADEWTGVGLGGSGFDWVGRNGAVTDGKTIGVYYVVVFSLKKEWNDFELGLITQLEIGYGVWNLQQDSGMERFRSWVGRIRPLKDGFGKIVLALGANRNWNWDQFSDGLGIQVKVLLILILLNGS